MRVKRTNIVNQLPDKGTDRKKVERGTKKRNAFAEEGGEDT